MVPPLFSCPDPPRKKKTVNKKILTSVTASLLGIGLLTGCGGQSAPAAITTVTQTVSPSSTSQYTQAELIQAYLMVIKTSAGDTGLTDAELVDIGKKLCRLVGLKGIAATTQQILTADVTPEVYGTVLGAATVAFCPQYTQEINDYLATFNTMGTS